MISTASGFIAGVLTGLLVSSMYGEQLSASLRDAVDHYSVLPLPGPAAPITPATLPSPTNFPSLKTGATPAPEAEPSPLPAPGSDEPPAEESQSVAELEQSWFDYAARAAELEPQGSFPWQECFQRAAASHDMPEALLLAIASGESNFDPAARSDKDAVGLMQIQWPATGHHLGIHREADLYDPCTNVDAGARYLGELMQGYADNLHLAVAAYNYGPTRVTAEQVPEGARWYSHYIYQHLQQVLGLDTTAASALLPPPADSGAGRQVLMTFNRAHRARDFANFLKGEVPGLKLQLQTEAMGQHEVVLLYVSDEERRRALQSLNDAGIGFISSQSKSKFYL